jgi:hypothetical protein
LGEPLSFPLLVFRSARLFAIAFIYICYISSEEEEQEQDLFLFFLPTVANFDLLALKRFLFTFWGDRFGACYRRNSILTVIFQEKNSRGLSCRTTNDITSVA